MTIAIYMGDRRLADDSPVGPDIPQDTTISTVAQGGYEQLSCSLLHPKFVDADEPGPDAVVRAVADAGARTVFEGRLDQNPIESGPSTTPTALGLNCLLEDDETIEWLGIARDATQFAAPTDARLDILYAADLKPSGEAAASDGGLRLTIPGTPWTSNPGRPVAEGDLTASPLQISRVIATLVKRAHAAGRTDISCRLQSLDAAWNYVDLSPDYGTTAGDTQDVDWSPAGGAGRLAAVAHAVASSGGTTDETLEYLFRDLAWLGDHGLPLYGSGPSDWGLLWSDVFDHLVGRFAPRPIRAGDIATSPKDLALQHLTFLERGTLGQFLTAGNELHQWAWGVWEGARVHTGPFGTGRSRTWYVREGDPGVKLSLSGVTRSQLWTDIVVDYRTPSGEELSVGDPGSIADTHDARLRLVDPTHPLLLAGTRRRKSLSLGIPADVNLARQLGIVALHDFNAARRSGRITVADVVYDGPGRGASAWPSYLVQGGDHIVVTDVGDSATRRVMRTTWSPRGGLVAEIDRNQQSAAMILAHLTARGVGA